MIYCKQFHKWLLLVILFPSSRACVREFPELTQCDGLSATAITNYNKICEEKDNSYKFHCQRDSDTNYCSVCAKPEKCSTGEHAVLLVNHQVRCEKCSHEDYQRTPKISTDFKTYTCDEIWKQCIPDEMYTVCKNGTPEADIHCRCNWRNGYKPRSSDCQCFSLDSDPCTCEKQDCQLGPDYECITTTTPIPTSVSSSSTTTEDNRIDDSTTNLGLSVGLPIALLTGAIFVIGLYICRKYLKSQCLKDLPRWRNETGNKRNCEAKEPLQKNTEGVDKVDVLGAENVQNAQTVNAAYSAREQGNDNRGRKETQIYFCNCWPRS